jgi:pimeloyl-ACP methyl ester carboxylesterase
MDVALASSCRRVLDISGHRVRPARRWGKSFEKPGAKSGSVAEDLDGLVGHLKIERFHLLGVAGGGFIALDYAAWRPERLSSLIVGASTGMIQDKDIADFIARIAIPGIREQSPHYREIGPSYRGANPDGVKHDAIEFLCELL